MRPACFAWMHLTAHGMREIAIFIALAQITTRYMLAIKERTGKANGKFPRKIWQVMK